MSSTRKVVLYLFISAWLAICYNGAYAENAKLTVPTDVRTDTLILTSYAAAPCACDSSNEGRIYYYNDGSKTGFYYCDGARWEVFGTDATAATRIVSAYNSRGALNGAIPCAGAGGACSNLKADYTCAGSSDENVINQAINSLGGKPGVVYLLEGTYYISSSSSITVNSSRQAIIGNGSGTVIKSSAGTTLALIYAVNTNQCLITGLTIDGAGNGSGRTGISFSNVTGSKIYRVWIKDISCGIALGSASNNNIVSNNHLMGVHGDGSNPGIIFLDVSSHNIIARNIVDGNAVYNPVGIVLRSSSDSNIVSYNQVSTTSLGGAIVIQDSSNNIVSCNSLRRSCLGSITGSGVCGGINIKRVSSLSCHNLVAHNDVYANNADGIIVSSLCTNNAVMSNNVYNNSYAGIYAGGDNSIIAGNLVSNNGGSDAYDGIYLGSSGDMVSANSISDTLGSGYGINIPPGFSNNYISGNLISGLAYIDSVSPPTYERGIADGGSNTKYTDQAKMTLEAASLATQRNPGSFNTLTPLTYTYIPLIPGLSYSLKNSPNNAVADGKSAGDLLVLENMNTNTITIPNLANTRLSAGLQKVLGQYDTLVLVWDGIDWVELSGSDN